MSKTIYCGKCKKFLHEDIEGYGICEKKQKRYVSAATSVT